MQMQIKYQSCVTLLIKKKKIADMFFTTPFEVISPEER